MTAPAGAIRKVRALLRLADPERGGTPAEQQAAQAKAQALASKHSIALDGLLDLADDQQPGEQTVRIDGPHRVWASILLIDVAGAFGVSLRLTIDGARLGGPADDVQRAVRAHSQAWTSVRAGHDALVSALTPDARGARRYLHARYPDPTYHADVLAHLRYWPLPRLQRDIATVLATSRSRSGAIARALRQGRVAPDDVAPSDALTRGYFETATFAIYLRLRDLQRDRGHRQRVEEPVNTPPAPAPPPPPAAASPAPRRRRTPRPPPEAAITAARAVAASSPIGLLDIEDPQQTPRATASRPRRSAMR